MQDVYFLDWSVDEGAALVLQTIGHIETSKATSDLFAPMPGRSPVQPELLADPSGINISNYATGWLFEMRRRAEMRLVPLIPKSIIDFLFAANWEKTQATIKGHL